MATIERIPHTAAPTWSGFIYQGYIAIYHAIECVINGESFELQIDSTDDFAIIINGKTVSTHQVKALSDATRDGYLEALEKASETKDRCTADTKRFMHTSTNLNDSGDYIGSNGNVVSFYKYDGKSYCPLHEIEGAIKIKIHDFLSARSLPSSDFLLQFKLEALNSHVSSQIVYIHACCQDKLTTAAKAAYTQTIKSNKIEELLMECVTHKRDEKYQRYEAKLAISEAMFNYANSMAADSDTIASSLSRVTETYRQIKDLSDINFTWLWKSLCLGSSISIIDKNTVYDYVDIIYEIEKQPNYKQKPPYYNCKLGNFFLPTAISAKNKNREKIFSEDLIEQIKKDPDLLDILYEFQWLIASDADEFSPTERFCTATGSARNAIEEDFLSYGKNRKTITKAMDAKVISINIAKDRLHD